MLHIRIITVGGLKEPHFKSAAEEYIKRLSPYCKLDVVHLTERRREQNPAPALQEQLLLQEAGDIESALLKGAEIIALCIEGRHQDSAQFARWMETQGQTGKSSLCFVIGGSNGLHEKVKNRADVNLSMSEMTFPHHLACVMLLEQIYRAFKISEGAAYHK